MTLRQQIEKLSNQKMILNSTTNRMMEQTIGISGYLNIIGDDQIVLSSLSGSTMNTSKIIDFNLEHDTLSVVTQSGNTYKFEIV